MTKATFYYFFLVFLLPLIFMLSECELSFAQNTPGSSTARVTNLHLSANPGTNTSMCLGNTITLSTSQGVSYLWSPSIGLNSTTSANPSCSATTSTTYTVTVTDSNNSTVSNYVTVTVYATPNVNFLASAACFTNPTVFTDQTMGNIVQWNWNFGEPSSGSNNTSSLKNPAHTYNSPGTYIVTLIALTSEGCRDTNSATVTVYPLPVTGFSSTTVCVGTPTVFKDTTTVSSGAIVSWSWNFGDPASAASNISNIENPSHIFSSAGNFNVLLTVTSDHGCQSTISFKAVVLFSPVAAFTGTNACLHTATVFTNQSTNATHWNWAFGDGGLSTSQNPTHTYPGYGNYVVTLVATGNACADTLSDTVVVHPLPVVDFMVDTVCAGDTTSFLDLSYISSGTIADWHWDFGDGNVSALQNPTHVYTLDSNYTVTLIPTSGNGCSDSMALPVLVYPLPKANFYSSPAPTSGLTDVVHFNDLSTGSLAQWEWDFGDGDTSHIQYPFHIYSDTGIFVVTLIATSPQGCADTARHTVEIKDFTFYIPNTFSPNGDGVNELFFGVGVGIIEYELTIFDRLGHRIFYCKVNDLPQTLPCMWDGKVENGSSSVSVQPGIYTWKVNLTSIFNTQYKYIGNVNIVK